MFERIAIQYLRQWAKKEDRKPLVLRGARQVGKTTLVKLFAKEFDTYIYMNLEEKEYAELFAAAGQAKTAVDAQGQSAQSSAQANSQAAQASGQAAAALQAQAKGAQASAQASAQAERYRPLVAANAISKQDFVNAEAAEKQAQADVAAAKAAVRTADINLSYASVTAPISGRIGRALVTEGALVGQGEATALAVVQQIDPVYVNFTQSAADVFQLRRAMESGQFKRAGGGQGASVKLVLSDGSEYAQAGKLLFTDLSVDSTTGQVTLRAEVPNPKGELLPGLYLRGRIEQAQASNAITLPQQAVTRTQQGDTVSVVGEDGKVSQRTVKISAAQNNRWVVLDGLKAGEKVMVDGCQKLQMLPPGTPVKPVPWQAPGTPAPAAATASAPTSAEAPAAPASAASKP